MTNTFITKSRIMLQANICEPQAAFTKTDNASAYSSTEKQTLLLNSETERYLETIGGRSIIVRLSNIIHINNRMKDFLWAHSAATKLL